MKNCEAQDDAPPGFQLVGLHGSRRRLALRQPEGDAPSQKIDANLLFWKPRRDAAFGAVERRVRVAQPDEGVRLEPVCRKRGQREPLPFVNGAEFQNRLRRIFFGCRNETVLF